MEDARLAPERRSPPSPPDAELAIVGNATTDHTVPAEVLARTLDGLQAIAYLLAAAAEGRPIGERFSLPGRFRERHALRCGMPQGSSYALPLAMEPGPPGTSAGMPLAQTLELFRLAALGDWSGLGRVVPDVKYIPRLLSELQAILPRPGDRWGIALRVGPDRVTLDARAYRRVRDFLTPTATEEVTTVTGVLVRVEFDKSRIVIRYAPTGREIPCYCEAAVLDNLLRDWHLPIQVTGRFTLDASGNPQKLTHVTRVEAVDLSDMTFDRIESGGRQLVIDPPLTLRPTLDEESGQLYMLTHDELGIDVFARTREGLTDELAEQLLFQWDAYACESPQRLTSAARRLRDALRSRLREDDLAAQPERR